MWGRRRIIILWMPDVACKVCDRREWDDDGGINICTEKKHFPAKDL